MTRTLLGWVFDVYVHEADLNVWVITDDGKAHHLKDRVEPSFFVYGTQEQLHEVCDWLRRTGLRIKQARAERYDPSTRKMLTVLEVRVLIPGEYRRIVQRVSKTFRDLKYYNADLDVVHIYFMERDVFPLARVRVVVDDADRIVEITALDSPWDVHYSLPPLRVMTLRVLGDEKNLNPNHGHRGPLEATYGGKTFILESGGKALVEQVRDLLLKFDPDALIGSYSDSYILPHLLKLAEEHGVELPLNRDTRLKPQLREKKSYWSYNRMNFRDSSVTLFGRVHLDYKNATLSDALQFAGMAETARLSQRTLQQSARLSSGSAHSAMQLAEAYRRHYLIPWRKALPEKWKTVRQFKKADQGGSTFRPRLGLHWNAAEIDFHQMYPALMEKFNISYETLHCSCCPDNKVPGLGYTICQKVTGLTPAMLRRLLQKRMELKKAKRAAKTEEERKWYQCLIDALKAILVTTFGYLGYKNSRFGRIEAHEATTAYARFVLALAKEIAEKDGFTVLHGLTDSLWVKKKNATAADYEALVEHIEEVTGLAIGLEGIYKWIAFVPSRVKPKKAVPTRYFGAFLDGDVKVRGIDLRRHDTPAWIKEVQSELLNVLSMVASREDIPYVLPELMEVLARQVDRLRTRQVSAQDLVITSRLSQAVEEMKANTLNAAVAREMQSRGITLNPGEAIRYIITNYKSKFAERRVKAWELFEKQDSYDVERYIELLQRAVEVVLCPFGISKQVLESFFKQEISSQQVPALFSVPEGQFLGPLFASLN